METRSKTPITSVIFEDAEGFLLENIEHFHVDTIAACLPIELKVNKEEGTILVVTVDSESDPIKEGCEDWEDQFEKRTHTLADCVQALKLLVEHVDNAGRFAATGDDKKYKNRWFGSGFSGSSSMVDSSNWDVEAYDAFFQLLHNREILYG